MKKILIAFLLSLTLTFSPGVLAAQPLQSGGFEYVLLEDGTASITRCLGEDTLLVLPETLDGHAVTAIGENAFRDQAGLLEVTVPQGVTVIGAGAFSNCTSLSTLSIPEGVTSIEQNAFKDCKDLTLTVPRGSYAEEYAAANGIPLVYADTGS